MQKTKIEIKLEKNGNWDRFFPVFLLFFCLSDGTNDQFIDERHNYVLLISFSTKIHIHTAFPIFLQ